ncbi:MAG: hypothetical protein LC700_02980 [Actinobacteria bacterium]|nr:hypothetical protein [Actinomycetota bacterium]
MRASRRGRLDDSRAGRVGTARGAWLRGRRLLAIDGFDADVPDSTENAAEFGHASSGENPVSVPHGAGGGVG